MAEVKIQGYASRTIYENYIFNARIIANTRANPITANGAGEKELIASDNFLNLIHVKSSLLS